MLLDALCTTPGADAWWALCRYLQEQPAESLPSLVDAADAQLGHWPDEFRLAPLGWWASISLGQPHPLWRLARALDLSCHGLGDADTARLADTPAVSSLTVLQLAHNELTAAGAARLAASPHLRGVVRLDLSHNRLTSDGAAALATSSSLDRLSWLGLSANGIGTAGAEALARAPWRFRADNDIGAAGVAALVGGPALRSIETLNLADNGLGSDGVAAFATARDLSALTELDLSGNAIGTGGAAALTLSPALAGLMHLRLRRNRLGASGIELIASWRLPALASLDVSGNDIGATGAMILGSSPAARRLKSLDVSDNQLGHAGLAALLGAPALAGLRDLSAARNGLSPTGLALVGTAPLELRRLDVSGHGLGDAGGATFGAAIARTHITTLHVAQAGLGGRGLAAIVSQAGGRLAQLDAAGNDLTADTAGAFAGIVEAHGLRELSRAGCHLDATALGQMLATSRLSHLERLDLSGNRLDADARAIVAARAASSPARAHRRRQRLGPDFVHALGDSSLPQRLHALALGHNRLDDEAVAALVRASWPALRTLRLNGNAISQGEAASIRSSPVIPLLGRMDLRSTVVNGAVDVHSLPKAIVRGSSRASPSSRPAAPTSPPGSTRSSSRGTPTSSRCSPACRCGHQQQHLLSALTLVIDHLRAPDSGAPLLEAMGRRHVGYRVQASHYVALTNVAVDVIRDTLGDSWTPDLYDAWHQGFEAIAAEMLKAHRDALASHASRSHDD